MDISLIEPLVVSRLLLVILLHFVWQATLICLGVVVIRALIHPRHVHWRYATSVIGLLLLVVATMATTGYYVWIDDTVASFAPHEEASAGGAAVSSEAATILETLESQFLSVFGWFDANRTLWLGMWSLGVLVLIGRLAGSLIYCFQLRRSRVALPPHLDRLAKDIKAKLQLTRDVVVASSTRVTQAVATGIIKPVVLIPVSWATELPVSAIEAVLAHELAHVKRWDLWVNLLQRLTETVFFFHPLVWWLSKTISAEREICCDQLAIRATGKPVKYVETLAQIATASTVDNLEIQLGTAFKGGKNMKLLRRAKMILEPGSIDSGSPNRALTLFVCVAMLASLGSYAYCGFPAPVQEEDNELIQRIELLVDDIERRQDLGPHEAHELHLELLHDEEIDRKRIARTLRALADQLESGSQRKMRARLHVEDEDVHKHLGRIRLHVDDDEMGKHRHRYRLRVQEQDDEGRPHEEFRFRGRVHDHDENEKRHEYRLRRRHREHGEDDEHHEYRFRERAGGEDIELEVHPLHAEQNLLIGRIYDEEEDIERRVYRVQERDPKDPESNEKTDYKISGQLLLRDAELDADVEMARSGRVVVDHLLKRRGGQVLERGVQLRELGVDATPDVLHGAVVDRLMKKHGGQVLDGAHVRELRVDATADLLQGAVVDRLMRKRGGQILDGVHVRDFAFDGEAEPHQGAVVDALIRRQVGETSDEGMEKELKELKKQVEHLRHELHELKSKKRTKEAGQILLERIHSGRQPMQLQFDLREPIKIKEGQMKLELDLQEKLEPKRVRFLSEIPQVGRLFERHSEEEVEEKKKPKKQRIKLRERVIDPETAEIEVDTRLLTDVDAVAKFIEVELDAPVDVDATLVDDKDIQVELIDRKKSDK